MSPWQRRLLWGSSTLVTLTGLAYAGMRYLMRGSDPFSAYGHPLQPWTLDAHVLLAPCLLFVIGWFWGSHVLPKLRRSAPARPSGITLIGLVVVMAASGYVLQVSALAGLRVAAAWTHGLAGTAFFVLLVAHVLRSRRLPNPGSESASR